MIYLVGGLGRLTAYRISMGEPVWSVDFVADLGGRVPPWGYTESVLIDGDKLICTPGSEIKGTFAALDKSTGQVLWRSTDVTARAEYGSPILIEHNNVRQVVTMSRSGLVAVSPEDGKFLWQHNRFAERGTPETTTAHGNSPAYGDGDVFEATSYYTRGGSAVVLKATASGVDAELAWERADCWGLYPLPPLRRPPLPQSRERWKDPTLISRTILKPASALIWRASALTWRMKK